jgi:hypothetical protein
MRVQVAGSRRLGSGAASSVAHGRYRPYALSMDSLAFAVAAVLIVLAVLHAYWAAGGSWPGRDGAALAQIVVGGPIGQRMPSHAACAAVAVALIAAAMLVLAAQGAIVLPVSSAIVRIATFGLAAVLTLRGAAGFLEARLRPVIAGTPYARLNTVAYSPLALALGLGTLAVVL